MIALVLAFALAQRSTTVLRRPEDPKPIAVTAPIRAGDPPPVAVTVPACVTFENGTVGSVAVPCGTAQAQPLRDAKGRIARSESAKNRFKRANPCPANGRDRGPCPGYVIDHVLPLACGGKDDPSNMQWQTVPEGKKKDRWELTQPGCPAKFSRWKRFTRAMNPGEKP